MTPHRLRICWSLLFPLAVVATAAAAGSDLRILEAPSQPLPEELLPHQFDDPDAATSARLLGMSGAMNRFGPWTVRLCRRDERATARFLAGLDDAAAGGFLENEDVASVYQMILLWCLEGESAALHPDWLLRAARGAKQPKAREVLWKGFASVHPLDEPDLFEREAPDAALIAYHQRRSDPHVQVYSERLAVLVERRLSDGDARRLGEAAEALARLSDPRAVETFRRLLASEPPAELGSKLWQALRGSPRADGFALFQEYCGAWLADTMQRPRAGRSSVRGSLRRHGDPCARDPFPFLQRSRAESATAERHRAPPPCDQGLLYRGVSREAVIGTCFDLVATRGTQFAGDVELLRQIAELVSPHLDTAVFAERWPAVDAVDLVRGPLDWML